MKKKSAISGANWHKSPTEYRTYQNAKGDTVTFFSESEALVNRVHIYGVDDIHRKIAEISGK